MHGRTSIYWSAQRQQQQDETQKSSYGLYCQQKDIWNGLTKLDNKLTQNVQLSNDITNFIEKTMKTWKVEITEGGFSLSEEKTQRGVL